MTLEKIIKYDQAILQPESELEKFENNSKIRLKPRNHLALLFHFPTPQNYVQQTQEAISQNYAIGMGALTEQKIEADIGPFGEGSNALVDYANSNNRVVFPTSDEIDQAEEFTAQFFAKISGAYPPYYRPLVARLLGMENINFAVFTLDHIGTELGIYLTTSQGTYVLETYGLNLQGDNWYHIRASVSARQKEFKLFCDGEEVAQGEIEGSLIPEPNPELRKPISFLDYGALLHPFSTDQLAEVEWYNAYLSEEYSPPTAPTKPFSQNLPKAQLSLDSGFNNALWQLSELSFFDETDFNNGGLKLRIDADNDHSPDFSGELLSLMQVRNLVYIRGRYLHLEFSFLSDGDSPRILYPGKIVLDPQAQIHSRYGPEIIRKF